MPINICNKRIHTGENDHVDAPGKSPEPADHHEGNCEHLGEPHPHVHTERHAHVIVLGVNAGFPAAKHTETTDHRA